MKTDPSRKFDLDVILHIFVSVDNTKQCYFRDHDFRKKQNNKRPVLSPKKDQKETNLTHFTEKETYLAKRLISTHFIKTDEREIMGKVVPERPNTRTNKCVCYHSH